jgi:hypothetical protein
MDPSRLEDSVDHPEDIMDHQLVDQKEGSQEV